MIVCLLTATSQHLRFAGLARILQTTGFLDRRGDETACMQSKASSPQVIENRPRVLESLFGRTVFRPSAAFPIADPEHSVKGQKTDGDLNLGQRVGAPMEVFHGI
jgi:hypothetical protein